MASQHRLKARRGGLWHVPASRSRIAVQPPEEAMHGLVGNAHPHTEIGSREFPGEKPDDIRRLSDGSVDVRFYASVANELRKRAIERSASNAWAGLVSAARTTGRWVALAASIFRVPPL